MQGIGMKIIHTSDWHLGHRLYNYDRSDEEEHFFRQLMSVVEREQPDAMVVSGDVFHTGAPGNDVARCFTDRLLDVQARCPAMETVIIAGNHDSYSRLVVDKSLWSRCRVHVLGLPSEDGEGRADFEKNVVSVGEKGLIAAVPFCHERNFPSVEGAAGESRAREYFGGLSRFVQEHAGGRPTVLAAHLAVRADLDFRGHDRALVVGGEESVGAAELGSAYDYIALGHIHCPQWVDKPGRHVRYCGTPRAIHFDETYEHGVDIVTVEAGHRPMLRTEAFKPLRALATLGGDEGMAFGDALAALESSSCEGGTYIRLNVRLGAGELPGPDWAEKARQACLSRNLRFCVNNVIRAESPHEDAGGGKALTVTELKELSSDMVVDILSARHELTARQRELVKSIMEAANA